MTASEEIDQYIRALPPFSREICERLRSIIHQAVPGIVEDWKWGPNFNSNGMVCGFGGFKKHVVLSFFNGAAMSDKHRMFNHGLENDHSRGIRYLNAAEIDNKKLIDYVKESAALNKNGYKKQPITKVAVCPSDLLAKLKSKPKAFEFFHGLATGYQNEFIELVETAKREETRTLRIEKVVTLCSARTKLNDKYKK